MDCSLNEDNGFLLQQSSQIQLPHSSAANKSSSNSLDKPFGMDLSVEFGAGHSSNRSSVVSQVSEHSASLS